MPTYRRLSLTNNAPALPARSMTALAVIEPDGPHQAMAALDTLGTSCRVLAGTGMYGCSTFTTPDGEPAEYSGSPRIYFDEVTPRIGPRMYNVPLTPGHVVELRVLALPSGPTQLDQGTNDFIESGRGGTITMEVTYTNAALDTVTKTVSVSPPASVALYGAEPASCHSALSWHAAVALPWKNVPSAADIEKWSMATATIVISYEGSPRVVDLAVVERPSQIVVDVESSLWPTAMYTQAGQPYAELPSDYPISRLSTLDAGGGLEAIHRALEQHGKQLGPCLAWWSAAREEYGTLMDWISYGGGTGDDEAPAVTGNSTAFRNIPYSTAPPLSGLPGFMLGGYARQARDGNAWFDGRTGVLPVWLVAYSNCTANTRFQFRAGDDEWSAVNVIGSATGFGWTIAPGWIEVGVGPEDAPIGRFYAKDSGAATWEVRAAGCFMRKR
jgi:hypothetical protein